MKTYIPEENIYFKLMEKHDKQCHDGTPHSHTVQWKRKIPGFILAPGAGYR